MSAKIELRCDALAPLGATVRGLSLGAVEPGVVAQVRTLLARHGVLIFPEQSIDDAAFVAFLASFGPLTFTAGETAVEGYPDLNVVSNVGRATPPKSNFHVDTSYVRHPPAYTALRAVTVAEHGGETLFTDQRRAYETLAPELRERLRERTITHVVTGVEVRDGDETSAQHPVFRRHPLSGETVVYLTTPARCAAISGLDDAEARETIAALYAHSTREENVLRHRWAPGDVVMWDNVCVLHRADHEQARGDRVMHRGMVARYG